MSHDSTASPRSPKNRDAAPDDGFEPTDAMRQRNRRFGWIFLGVVAFLVVLTVVTRIILSS